MAPATDPRAAVIVAHGSPSDPPSQERAIRALAAQVGAFLPGWAVHGATLAAPDRFEAALARAPAPLVYPFFMARGWFTETCLIRRIGEQPASVAAPFGVEPGLAALAASRLRAAMALQHWEPRDTALLVAAHGSASCARSADSALALTRALGGALGMRTACTGFIEQPPHLAHQARGLGQAICLPFFATRAGHMTDDLPAALEKADFAGPVLPAFADLPETPALIAQGLARAMAARRAA